MSQKLQEASAPNLAGPSFLKVTSKHKCIFWNIRKRNEQNGYTHTAGKPGVCASLQEHRAGNHL